MPNIIPKLIILAISLSFTIQLWAHGTETHSDTGISVNPVQDETTAPLPIDITAEFTLTDHHGNAVNHGDYSGKHMLVFFGYASCKNMCSISLTRISDALTILGDSVDKLSPIIITVDPERDTPEVLQTELPKYHSSLIGLTGNSEQLENAYQNFNQKPVNAGNDWNNDPIISHSSYIYCWMKMVTSLLCFHQY